MTENLLETQHLLERAQLRLMRGHVRGLFAATPLGLPIPQTSPWATRFCGEGAVRSFRPRDEIEVDAIGRLNDAAYQLRNRCVIAVNDQIGRKAVIEVFDLAIKRIQAEREAGLNAQLEAIPSPMVEEIIQAPEVACV